jgi:hypothetical protein
MSAAFGLSADHVFATILVLHDTPYTTALAVANHRQLALIPDHCKLVGGGTGRLADTWRRADVAVRDN